jgi:bla regulator protein blaR1
MNVLDVCVRATILLGLAGVAAVVLQRASAAARHLLWASTLSGLLVLPALYLLVPALPVAVPAVSASVPVDRMVDEVVDRVLDAPVGVGRAGPAQAVNAPASPSPVSLAWVLVVVWGVGAAAIVARLGLGLWRVRSFVGGTTEVVDAEWVVLMSQVSRRLGVRRRVGLRMTAAGAVPVTCGMVRPTVIVPADAMAWDPERRLLVAMHEMAHVRRLDVATHVVGQLALAIFWFHPLAWLAATRMRLECERACDDLVLAAGVRPSRYAGDLLALVDTLRAPGGPAAVAALAMGRRTEIEARLVAILDAAVRRGPIGAGRMVAALGVAAVAVGTMAAVRPVVAHELALVTLQAVRVVGAPVDDDGARAPVAVHHVRPEIVLANAATDASRLGTDADKRRALLDVARRYCGHDTLRVAFFAATRTIGSDVERRRVLVGLLEHGAHDGATVAAIVSSAQAMTSDSDRAIVLRAVARAGRSES